MFLRHDFPFTADDIMSFSRIELPPLENITYFLHIHFHTHTRAQRFLHWRFDENFHDMMIFLMSAFTWLLRCRPCHAIDDTLSHYIYIYRLSSPRKQTHTKRETFFFIHQNILVFLCWFSAFHRHAWFTQRCHAIRREDILEGVAVINITDIFEATSSLHSHYATPLHTIAASSLFFFELFDGRFLVTSFFLFFEISLLR